MSFVYQDIEWNNCLIFSSCLWTSCVGQSSGDCEDRVYLKGFMLELYSAEPLISANFWTSLKVFNSCLGDAAAHSAIDLIFLCIKSRLHGS